MCRNAWCGTPIASPRSLVLGTVVMTTGCIMACVAVLRILGSGLQPLCQPQRMPQLLRAVNTSTTGIESLALQCDLEQTSSDDCVQCKMTADGLYYIQIRPFQITRDAAEEFYEAWEKYHYEFRLLVLNELSEPTSLHAHGLNPPNGQDGVAYITEPPIPPGEEREYRFRAQVGGGSFWLHAHSGLHAGLGLWIPLVLQHPSQEIQKLGNPRELILMAEDQFVHPYCAYRPFLYPEKCQHLLTTEHTKVAYYLNRRTSPQVVRCSAGEKFMLRLGNAGTEATWHFNLSWFSNAMLLALDGNNVQRAHMVDTKEHAIILSSAQRTDVLVQVPGSGCYPIIVSSGSHAGEEQHPVSRVLFLDASELPEPCAPPEFPRFMPAYSRFSRLTPARYPMKKHKIMRNLSWEISVGEQFGGFAGNCYAGEQIHLCREYKWPLPPSRSWQHVETGYMVPRVVLSIVSMYECPS